MYSFTSKSQLWIENFAKNFAKYIPNKQISTRYSGKTQRTPY